MKYFLGITNIKIFFVDPEGNVGNMLVKIFRMRLESGGIVETVITL